MAALNHSRIRQLYDVGPNYLVFEYVEGQPLKGRLPPDKRWSMPRKSATRSMLAQQENHAPGSQAQHSCNQARREAPRFQSGEGRKTERGRGTDCNDGQVSVQSSIELISHLRSLEKRGLECCVLAEMQPQASVSVAYRALPRRVYVTELVETNVFRCQPGTLGLFAQSRSPIEDHRKRDDEAGDAAGAGRSDEQETLGVGRHIP